MRKISINLHDIIVLFGAHSIYIKVLTRVKGQTTSDWDTAEPGSPPTFPHTFNHHLLQTRKIPWTFLNQLITNCNFDMICECLYLLFHNTVRYDIGLRNLSTLHILPNPGQIFVNPGNICVSVITYIFNTLYNGVMLPGINSREVRPGAVHPEAGDPDDSPGVGENIGEQSPATVTIASVPSPVTRTQLVLPDGDPADGGVGRGAGGLADHGDLGLPQSVLRPAARAGGAPADDEGAAGGCEGEEVLVVVVVRQTGSSAVQSYR